MPEKLALGVDQLAGSGSIVIEDISGSPSLIRSVRAMLKERHAIEHVTVQVEDEALAADAARLPV